MPEKEKEQEKPSPEPVEGTVYLATHGYATSSATVRVRLVQQSPTANPKLVEAARRLAQRLNEEEGDEEKRIEHIPEAPLILPEE
jgi:broad specificity phosphatase PhoE